VSEACTELIHVSPEYDRFYVEHRSLRLDLWIAMRTALQMAGLGRCITLTDVPDWALVLTPAEVIDLRDVIDLGDAATNDAVLGLPATASR
jgi:hypothetical protein